MQISNNNQTQYQASKLLKTKTLDENQPLDPAEEPQQNEDFAGELAAVLGMVQTGTPKKDVKSGNGAIEELASQKSEKGVKGDQGGKSEMIYSASTAKAPMMATEENGKAQKSQIEFQDPKKEIQLRNDFRSNGVMTDVLGAGPTHPWNSNWVFGAGQSDAQEKALVGNAQYPKGPQGSDEKILRMDTESLESKMAQLKGMIQSLDKNAMGTTAVETEAGTRAKIMAGEDYLQSMNSSSGERSRKITEGGEDDSALMQPEIGVSGSATNPLNQAQLRSIPGGHAKMGKGDGSEESLFKGISQEKDGPKKSSGMISSRESAPHLPTFETIALTHGKVAGGANLEGGAPTPSMTGNVIPGSMMKDRLASESVVNFSNQISALAPKGGGEMKIRLNPENLGELVIHVSTQGKDVGLRVQATRGEAKKILEESVASLKDALSAQNLHLSKMEFTVAPVISTQTTSSDARATDQQSTFANQGRDSSGSERRGDGEPRNNVRSFQDAQAAFSRTPRQSVSAGRLDVTA